MKSDHSDQKDIFPLHNQSYRHLFLVQNRIYWRACPFSFDKDQDLVLTYDFGVFKELRDIGGRVDFLDHLIDPDVMERYNYETYDYFAKWHYDQDGNDIFSYKGIKVGNAFRIAIWSNITQYARTVINLLAVRKIKCEKMFVGISDCYTLDILKAFEIEMETWKSQGDGSAQEYYFPILQWIDERIYPSGIKQVCKFILAQTLDLILLLLDSLKVFQKKNINIYIHSYHPTKRIIKQLKNISNINLIFENYNWAEGPFKERRLPVRGPSKHYKRLALEMINKLQSKNYVYWTVEGFPISDYIYPIIFKRISEPLSDCLKTLDSIIKYFKKRKLKLMVAISNLGFTNCLMLNYCHQYKIPTYLIINGLEIKSFGDESKDATWINAYGESIKVNYFRGMKNIVCLGDPRMDEYNINYKQKHINNKKPTILIAASGFSNIDLNSYVAVEFDFLHDVLNACQTLMTRGKEMDIVLKLRANGYIAQYSDFLKEYFPKMIVQIYDQIPMIEVLSKADYFITFYSQTLFEASCMGIPVLYYKKDTEISHPPFDGKSELVTAFSLDDLVEKMEMFYGENPIYEAFMNQGNMEKYMGPLDGNNLQRNMDFIYSLIRQPYESGVNKNNA